MKKRNVIIISAVVGGLVLLVWAFINLIWPRVMLHKTITELLPECTGAEYFTDFSLKNEDTFTVSNAYYSIDIPASFTKKEVSEELSVLVYENVETDKRCMIMNEPDCVPMSLLEEYEKNETDDIIKKYGISSVESMLTSLGYGTPDSYYNIMKCALLLDYEDYDFWNLDKMVAFWIYGTIRINLYEDTVAYLYEREDICAIVEGRGMYIVSVMPVDDLNTIYTFTVRSDDVNEVFAILNSFQFK